MNKRISLQIATKDRWSELALLLQSLRTQTYQTWDLVICDESQTSIMSSLFIPPLLERIKQEGHCVLIFRNELSQGPHYARNLLIDADYLENYYTARIDDDIILEPDYLQKLIDVIDKGYDIASGVTPSMHGYPIVRKLNNATIINDVVLNDKGEITLFGDDCGCLYDTEKILPTPHFRSCALYKSVLNKFIKYPTNLSLVGFREETFFSFKALLLGYKIGVHTGAIAWHLQTPTGGCRPNNYVECATLDEETFKKWTKKIFLEHGNFIEKYKLKIKNE